MLHYIERFERWLNRMHPTDALCVAFGLAFWLACLFVLALYMLGVFGTPKAF